MLYVSCLLLFAPVLHLNLFHIMCLALSFLYCMLLYSVRHLVALVLKVYYYYNWFDLAHQMFLVKKKYKLMYNMMT